MRKIFDKIWFTNGKSNIAASITFTAQVNCIDTTRVAFAQKQHIRSSLYNDIYSQMYGHMPQTCSTIIKHLKQCESEARSEGLVKTANRLAAAGALVDSLKDQMTSPTLQSDPEVPQSGFEDNIIELIQLLTDE